MGWLACSPGWHCHDKYIAWSIFQSLPATICGLSVDPDKAIQGDYGAIPPAVPVA
jgi:hypothetical protein